MIHTPAPSPIAPQGQRSMYVPDSLPHVCAQWVCQRVGGSTSYQGTSSKCQIGRPISPRAELFSWTNPAFRISIGEDHALIVVVTARTPCADEKM